MGFSAVSHICSTVIESRLARKVSPALRTAGSMTHKQDRVCGQIFRIGGAQRHRNAHNRADSDALTLARSLITTVRAAHAFKDVCVD